MIKIAVKSFIIAFNAVCIIAPFGIAVFLAAVYIVGGWGNLSAQHAVEFYFLPKVTHKCAALVMTGCISLSIVFIIKLIGWLRKRFVNEKRAAVASAAYIFLIAVSVRIPLIYMFREDIQPWGDFLRVWNMAHGEMEGHIEYYSLFPSYLNYTVFIRKLLAVFGDRYMNLIYINILLASLTAALLYLIAKIVLGGGNEKVSLLAGLLYALMPSNIVYCAVGTPEFITIAMNVLGALFLAKSISIKRRGFILALAGGVFVGIGSSYKSFGIIIIIAAVMAYAARMIIGTHGKYRMVVIMLYAVLVFAGHGMLTKAVIHDTENVLQISINQSTAYPHFFLIGLNTQGEGQIHIGNLSRQYYLYYLNNGYDADDARKYAMYLLADDWEKHTDEIVPNFLKKMIWAWQDDNIPIYYFRTSIGLKPDTLEEKFVYNFAAEYLSTIEQFYYLGLMLAAAIGCIIYSRKEYISCKREFLMLIVFGYFCLMLLSESQSRYKCLIMPYVCILAASGIYESRDLVRKRIIKKKDNND